MNSTLLLSETLRIDDRRPGLPLALYAASLAAAYGVFAFVAIWLSRQPGSVATLWYANAITVALLQSRQRREWPALVLAAALGNIGANLLIGDTLGLTLSFIPGNVCEILLGACLLRRFCEPRRCVTHSGELLKALSLGGLAPALLGAVMGAATLSWHGFAPFGKVWLQWFEGSAIGAVSVLPLGLLIQARGLASFAEALCRPRLAAAVIATTGTIAFVAAELPYPHVYVSVVLAMLAGIGGFAAAASGVLAASLTYAVLIACALFRAPVGLGVQADVLFHLPLMLTLVPPMLLAAALERNQQNIRDTARREAYFRAIYQQTPMMMHSTDRRGRLVSVSDAWLSRTGYERREVIGRLSTDFLAPQSRQRAIEVEIPRFMAEGTINDVPLQMLTRSGRIIDIRLSAVWERDPQGDAPRSLVVIEDVTEQQRLARQLAAEQERIEVTLQAIGDGVVTTDEAGRISYLNPVAEALLAHGSAWAIGRPFTEVVVLLDPQGDTPMADPIERCLQSPGSRGPATAATLRNHEGCDYGVQFSVAPIVGRSGLLLGAVIVLQDVTDARDLANRMAYLAQHDSLTDLPNRVLFQDRVQQACQAGLRRQHAPFAVMFMDLDRFKRVNDQLGHAAGDALLKIVAERLGRALRGSDSVCRLGGDEFVMLVGDCHAPADADEVARRIILDVAQACSIEGNTISVSLSMGIARFPADGEDFATLMKNADAAMYRAKRSGRNRAQFYSHAIDGTAPLALIGRDLPDSPDSVAAELS